MIARSLLNFKGPINLLQQHDPGQVVGEGHGRHGQLDVGLRLDGGVQAVAAPDEKDHVLLPADPGDGEHLEELLAGAQPPLDTQRAHPGAGRDLGPDGVPLFVQGVGDLPQGGVLGQLGLGNLDDGQLAVGGQPLDILGAGVLDRKSVV